LSFCFSERAADRCTSNALFSAASVSFMDALLDLLDIPAPQALRM
jgi:hypothetical protein